MGQCATSNSELCLCPFGPASLRAELKKRNKKKHIVNVLYDTKDDQEDILCTNALNLQNNLLQKFNMIWFLMMSFCEILEFELKGHWKFGNGISKIKTEWLCSYLFAQDMAGDIKVCSTLAAMQHFNKCTDSCCGFSHMSFLINPHF